MEERKIGFTSDNVGLATVEMEPKRAAAKKAEKYPTFLAFCELGNLRTMATFAE